MSEIKINIDPNNCKHNFNVACWIFKKDKFNILPNLKYANSFYCKFCLVVINPNQQPKKEERK